MIHPVGDGFSHGTRFLVTSSWITDIVVCVIVITTSAIMMMMVIMCHPSVTLRPSLAQPARRVTWAADSDSWTSEARASGIRGEERLGNNFSLSLSLKLLKARRQGDVGVWGADEVEMATTRFLWTCMVALAIVLVFSGQGRGAFTLCAVLWTGSHALVTSFFVILHVKLVPTSAL